MKTIKVPHGSARAKRRENMAQFKREQRARADILAGSTFSCHESQGWPAPKERNPYLRDVAIVIDEGGGLSTVATYESTSTFPANVACSSGRARLFKYPMKRHAAALATAARINQL